MNWDARAACRQVDPDLHFPVSFTERKHAPQVAQAKAVCAGCPVRAACLADALARNEPEGIWGGETPAERQAPRSRGRGRGSNQTYQPPNTPQPINHGTSGGWQVHRKRGEEACKPCTEAWRAYQREYQREQYWARKRRRGA